MSTSAPSRVTELGARVVHAALSAIEAHGGEMRARDVTETVGKTTDLDAFARERLEKTGNIRWRALLHLFSIEFVKAGYLVKKDGIWYVTDEGREALKMPPSALLESARARYKEWKKANPPEKIEPLVGDETVEDIQTRQATVEEVQQQARDGIATFINAKNPYEFQDLAAALLRGMGYHTPFVAPRGKDGGIDIVAYRDPLGTESPRMKVQIKHRPDTPASVVEIRQLMGILQKDGDVGIFIASGGFTQDSKVTARTSHVHVELIDLERFVSLWQQFYHKLTDNDKSLLPLVPVYFLAPIE